MPRITAPTVAQHRVNQRAAILAAAEQLAATDGATAVTVAAVAARSGLARPSVYAYFGSASELLVALVEEAFARWGRTLAEVPVLDDDPVAAVHAWFDAVARSAAEGNHRLAGALQGVTLPVDVRSRLAEGHRTTAAPLVRAAEDLGSRAEAAMPYLQAVAERCIQRVEAGADPAATAASAARFAIGGLRALADP